MSTIAKGSRHLHAAHGRWRRADDLTDAHIAHRLLNEQYRKWMRIRRQGTSEIQQNITLLKRVQRQQTYQMQQRLAMQKKMAGRGYGGGFYGLGGGSSFVTYKLMQWGVLRIKMLQEPFIHTEITPSHLSQERDRIAHRRRWTGSALLGLVLPLLWLGLWLLSATAALTVTLAAALLYVMLAWSKGRNPTFRRPPVPKLLFAPPDVPAHTEDSPEAEPEPFALAEAGRDPRQVREALSLAIAKHAKRVTVGEIHTPEETTYGWHIPLVLKEGTAADLAKALPQVAVPLRVGTNRITAAATDPNDAALLNLRLLTHDPFADPLPIPHRPPNSCTIKGQFDLGLSIEGQTTPVMLAGQHMIIVADTGGGKTALTQRIVEYVTACSDAVVADIDPRKRGLKVFAPLAALTARSPEEAEERLQWLIAEARRRIASMPATQDLWEPTPDDPAIVVILDEFVKLSPLGKELAAELLRNLGREALISIVIITQDATEDMLGDAIADVPGVRIMLPCRTQDVPLVVGRPNAISLGWWPHLLVPSPDAANPADAGRFYAITPRDREPILRYASLLPTEEAVRRVEERLAAPRPRLRLDPEPAVEVPEIGQRLRAAFATHSDPEALSVVTIAEHLATYEPAVWRQWDDREERDRRAQLGKHLKAQLDAAGLDLVPDRISSLPGRPTGYRLADLKAALGEGS